MLILHMPERGALSKGEKMQSPKKVLPGKHRKVSHFFVWATGLLFFFFGSQVDGNLAVARAGTSRWQMSFQRGGEFARMLGALFPQPETFTLQKNEFISHFFVKKKEIEENHRLKSADL